MATDFLKNLAATPINVYRPGSTFLGFSLAVYPTAHTICATPLDRIAVRELVWANAGNPAELLEWALAVFAAHGVEPEPPYPTGDLRATWTGKVEWWRRREPPTDLAAIRDARLKEGARLPPRFLAEVDAWSRAQGGGARP